MLYVFLEISHALVCLVKEISLTFFPEMLVLLLRTSFHEAYGKIYSKDKLDRGYGYTF